MATKTKSKKKEDEEKTLTIAQQAGYARRKLKNRDIEYLVDHKGLKVPINYVDDIDILKHWETIQIIERAKELREELAKFKGRCQQVGDELYDQLMREDEIRGQSVGGFTMATFDKEMKVLFKMDTVQVKIPEELTKAEDYWNRFLEDYYGDQDDKDALMIELVNELLHNTKDQIDLRNIGRLNRLGSKIDNKLYYKFLKHLNQAYDTNHTKRYEQFQERNAQGEYDSIVLTYTRVDPKAPEDE